MKKYIAMIAAAALLLTGCQSNQPSTSSVEDSSSAPTVEQNTAAVDTSEESTPAAESDITSVQPTTEVQTTETSTEADSAVFRTGVWRGTSGYFLFRSASEGATLDFEIGTGVPFDYEYGDGNIVFHMGSADNNTIAVPSDITDDSVTLTWEDGTAENFVFVSSDAEGFRFYCNEELEKIARRYFQENNPDAQAPELADVKSNDDGYAVVQLYDMDGDNVITSAWYMINRVTLTGSDGMTGSAVNMSGFAEVGTAEG